MKTILILGAGLSSSSLIRYLLEHADSNHWQIRITDRDLELVQRKINGNRNGVALNFNALDQAERRPEIEAADLVISMLPAQYHPEVAQDCIDLRTHLITPSYVSAEMKGFDQLARKAGIILMNEIGVDPGIDHMSAARILDEIKAKGGHITAFKSWCGGLISPEHDNNPWHYKFTWNPRNVVMAGSGGTARYIENGQYKYISYPQLFDRLDHIEIAGYGKFDGYANRDSLSYRSVYGLEDIPTIYRGTLRRPGFCQAWNIFVQLGMTDDSYVLEHAATLTARQFLNAFLPYHPSATVEEKFAKVCLNNKEIMHRFEWLGFFDDQRVIGFEGASPARLLEAILVEKWKLEAHDKDMLVMYHLFEYDLQGQRKTVTSSMVNIGEDQVFTSMSNTVGLPVAIAAKMILNGSIQHTGVQIPVLPEIYNPILDELESLGIGFEEYWM